MGEIAAVHKIFGVHCIPIHNSHHTQILPDVNNIPWAIIPNAMGLLLQIWPELARQLPEISVSTCLLVLTDLSLQPVLINST